MQKSPRRITLVKIPGRLGTCNRKAAVKTRLVSALQMSHPESAYRDVWVSDAKPIDGPGGRGKEGGDCQRERETLG